MRRSCPQKYLMAHLFLKVDVCDDQLKTVSTFASEYLGKKLPKTFDGVDIYHDKNISDKCDC